ncbi:aldose epimerase family protein [Shewanella cyperi]|uniref:aldose epimerase family protein n=1 Tax=Shewanella cyperi TaxID=2814292 RepID=UPI001A941D47|nr:aldose epimerase family protein [Shewanella cyperi]QSX40407.1 galactose mutarotase [Shewanella cyperi]
MVRFTVLDPWQDPRGGEIERVRLDNGILALEVLSLGGIIRSLWAPDRHGERANIVLGAEDATAYLEQQAHLGAIAGRYANRIAGGKLSLQGKNIQLDTNLAGNCLHGGFEGFNRRRWQLGMLSDGVRLTLVSPDGDGGFPGECRVQLDYRLAGHNLYVEMQAVTDSACPVSLTQHSYFNLEGSKATNADHRIQILADKVLTLDETGIPNGIRDVTESVFDLRQPQRLGDHLSHEALAATKGYDHPFWLDNDAADLKKCAVLSSPVSGRRMTLYSNQPTVQLYCANFLGGTPGRAGQSYRDYQAVCLEPQLAPDAPNQPDLGRGWLQAGEVYHHISRYRFDCTD